jgi:predicted CXXCH cytochrome family protein
MRVELRVLPLTLILAACSQQADAPWLTMPNAGAHAKYFGIAPGDTHGPQPGQAAADCNACHAIKTSGTNSVTTSVASDSFKVFTCTNCHAVTLKSGVPHDGTPAAFRTWHVSSAGVNAATFDSTVSTANTLGYDPRVAAIDIACYTCHRNGIGVDHAPRFILPHQNAAGTVVAACSNCHVVPGDRKQLGCSACHPHDTAASDAAHATLVPGYLRTNAVAADVQASSLLCARCHEDGKVPVRVAAHTTASGGFIISTGKHAGVAGGACLTCHDQNKTTPPRTFVADFTSTNCIGCHDVVVRVVGGANVIHGSANSLAPLHTSVADFNALWTGPQLAAHCVICHSDGGASGAAPSNHEQLFPRAAGTKHEGISCASCHTNAANRKDLTAFGCAACHAGITTPKAPPTGTTPKTLTAAHNITGYTITTYLTATTAGGTKTTVPISMADSQSCLRCHADGQVDRITDHPNGDSSFGTRDHHTAGCLTCHSTLRTDKPWGTNFKEAKGAKGPPPTGCYVCHKNGSG